MQLSKSNFAPGGRALGENYVMIKKGGLQTKILVRNAFISNTKYNSLYKLYNASQKY